jgi:hypothetical protein
MSNDQWKPVMVDSCDLGRGPFYHGTKADLSIAAFEDDPNLTNKRFPGNPTKSYRARNPLKVVGIVNDWQGHAEADIHRMLNSLLELTRRGLGLIED